jgi:hypothetical protein
MNTYLLWLRFEKMRARLDEAAYQSEIALARVTVAASDEPHWAEYLAAWPEEPRRPMHARGRAVVDNASAGDTPLDEVPPLDEAAAAEAAGSTAAPAEPATIAVVETTTTTTETTVYIDSPSIRA